MYEKNNVKSVIYSIGYTINIIVGVIGYVIFRYFESFKDGLKYLFQNTLSALLIILISLVGSFLMFKYKKYYNSKI